MELVMCMDIGSSHTGYAFSSKEEYRDRMLEIHLNEEWMSGHANLHTFKAPSTVLLKQDKSFHAFGYDAERKYTQLAENKQQDMYYFFKRFKADFKTKQFRKDSVIAEEGGKSMNGIALFTLVIKYLKSHFLESLEEGARYQPSEISAKGMNVKYVITVPTKWDAASKECVKTAAKKAGIGHCIIHTESEAVGRYCRLVPIRATSDGPFYTQRPFSRHAIVNIGGCGIDTAIQEIGEKCVVKEFSKNIGNASGSTRVDVDFLKFFNTLFGSEFCETYAKKHRHDFLELQYEFEVRKRQFFLEQEVGTNLQLPSSLIKMYSKKHKQSLQFMIDDTDFVGRILSKEESESIVLDKTVMKDIFGPAVKSTVGYLTNLSKDPELKQCELIILVGGFSDSPVVRGAIKFFFPNSNLAFVEEAELAVLRGGVLLGHDQEPDLITRTQYSYGLGMAMPYNATIHPKKKRFVAHDVQYCADVFQAHIVGGKYYRVGKLSSESHLQLNRPLQKCVTIPVYVSRDKGAQFTTDDKCSLLGKLSVNISDRKEGKAKVKVQMALLGDTLIVSGIDEGSNECTQAAFPLACR